MSFFSLLFVLFAEQFRPSPVLRLLWVWLGGWSDQLARRLNGGLISHGRAAWCLFVLPWVGGALFFHFALAYAVGGLGQALDGLVHIIVLYVLLGFRQESHFFTDIQWALQAGDLPHARHQLGAWRGASYAQADAEEVARLAIEEAILASHRNVFAVIFWFMVLPGVSGVVLYRLAQFLSYRWGQPQHEPDLFGVFARQAFQWLDFLPVRLTSFTFMVMGDFEDAQYCRKTQAQFWPDRDEGILLASGGGALGVRLGGEMHENAQVLERPILGLEAAATVNAMQRTAGLMWRALLLCLAAVALIDVIGWTGLAALRQ